jgi:[glutamine synthetase] adenylyltransferase / [glutamine synthetase]-adenylyl-L-tyrosine phosphorylase
MREEFAPLQFLEGIRESGSLERLEKSLAPSLLLPLASLLAQSPDPQGALRQLDRYVEAGSADILEDLARHPSALIYLVAIFGYSEFLAEAILADPSLVIQFARDRHLTKLKSNDELMQDYARYSVTSPDLWLSSQLARFKRRNVLRIALKDVLGLSTLGETTLELATLADVILNHSLAYCDRELEKRYGLPQYRDRQSRIVRSGFSILSLGKLGGNELNYSPDIDLLFIYARDGETSGGSETASVISNKEYFVRLSEAVNRTISQSTPHGEVYRVDLGKRPEGEEGSFTISVNSALEYYDRRARDWELQMLIKARHSAGDARVSREFLHGVEPFVYRSTGAAKGAASRFDEREKLPEEGNDGTDSGLDVKFHPGGLRDIESLTQTLQRIHGANDFWVRSGGTLLALRKLHEKGHLADTDFARLTSAYEFLRKVEHRIQLEAGPHPNRLPAGGQALDRLARRVNNELALAGDAGEVLVTQLKQTFFTVQEINHGLIQVGDTAITPADFELSAAANWPSDSAHDPFHAAIRLLGSCASELAAIAREAPLGSRARNDAARLITAILGSSECLRAVRQNPGLLHRALDITAVSTFLAQIMIQQPKDLVVLGSQNIEDLSRSPAQMKIRLQENSLTGGSSLAEEPGTTFGDAHYVEPFAWVTENGLSLTEKMSMLRTEYRAQTLALGARDCAQLGSITASLSRWNRLATRCISSAVEIAERSLSHGRGFEDSSFVVLGLGRLGRSEFDLGSTAELVFVVPGLPKEEQIESCSRLAERIVGVLSSYTCEGDVFPTELPLQFQGPPMVTEDGLLRYFAGGANFDHVPRFAHACPVAGNLEFGRELLDRLGAVLFNQFDSRINVEEDLPSLFSKFVGGDRAPNSRPPQPSVEVNAVGLALGALRLRHHLSLPAGTNIPEQITALHAAGLISPGDADSMSRAVNFLASVDHAFRLVTGAAPGELPEIVTPSEEVENLIRHWGLMNADESLTALLAAASHRLYAVCLRLAGLSPETGTTGVSR